MANLNNCQRLHYTLLSLLIKTKISLLLSPSFKIKRFSSQVAANTTIQSDSNSSRKEETLLSIFKQCVTMTEVEQIHSQIIQSGFHQNLHLLGRILVFCAVSNRGSMDYAASVFENVGKPDGFLWNTMIRGFVRTMQVDQAFAFFKKMQENGELPDNFSFSFLLKLGGQMRSVLLGKQLHCSALKYGVGEHDFVRNTLIHMYGMFKDIDTAVQLFEEITSPQSVAWNTIINCHVSCGDHKEAIELFLRMGRCGIQPDDATVVVILSACSGLGALDFGRWLHSCIDRTTSMGDIVSVSNSLIDMYSKCGAVEEAYAIFSKMKKRNLVTWNAMILGLATHGKASTALDLFSIMLDQETPDDVTFLGVLCACSHGGMVEEGRRYFDLMQNEYHIQPTMKHYGSLVDILGRAGFVEEAYRLVKSMPMKCNAIVWRTLLAACSVHGNIELGEEVRRHLLELEPDHSSDYVLLANTYASAEQWKGFTEERKSMRERGVQKPMPGNSLIGASLISFPSPNYRRYYLETDRSY